MVFTVVYASVSCLTSAELWATGRAAAFTDGQQKILDQVYSRINQKELRAAKIKPKDAGQDRSYVVSSSIANICHSVSFIDELQNSSELLLRPPHREEVNDLDHDNFLPSLNTLR
jgi:hypothetical protein